MCLYIKGPKAQVLILKLTPLKERNHGAEICNAHGEGIQKGLLTCTSTIGTFVERVITVARNYNNDDDDDNNAPDDY